MTLKKTSANSSFCGSHVMIQRYFVLCLVSVSMTLLADSCEAQIGFGVTRQGTVVSGGSLQVGGFVTPGRTGARLGVSTYNNQLLGFSTFTVQSGRDNPAVANNRRQPRPTPGRFVRASQRFDADKNELLDEIELATVGAAVLAEMEQQKAAANRRPVAPRKIAAKSVDGSDETPVDPQIKAFVKRCLRYDKDKDGSLNKKETSKMAKALIRSLS
jgi:hypothetical protein